MDNTPRLPRILVVDESRMARAMIIRNLSDHYSCREEADGESAWQVLVLDSSIELVVCSLSLPVLDGDGLLVRVRSSRLPRISQMPMLMIAGEHNDQLERVRLHGASDVIQRETLAAEWQLRIDSLIQLAQARHQLKASQEEQVLNPDTGLFTRKYVELQAVQAMSHALRHGGDVSAMVMGFDRFDALRDEYGSEVMVQLEKRFAAILLSKIRKEDSLGHFTEGQLVVVSPGTPYPSCESFGTRLRKAILEANIAIRGNRLNLSVSIGVSSSPTDKVSSAGALLELAASRQKAAQQGGGDRVIGCGEQGLVVPLPPTLERALALISSGKDSELLPYLDVLSHRLLPLLKLLERERKWDQLAADVAKEPPDLAQDR